jgi:hypothetical protein
MAASMLAMDVSSQARDTIDATVREFVSKFALRDIEIRAAEDHYGEPALFIDVRHDLSQTPIEPEVLTSLVISLQRKLLDIGEDRFPFVRHHFDDDQKVAGYK